LGTGTPAPDPDRCGSGTAVVTERNWVLIDCGRAVAQRVMQAGLDLRRLRAVMLTHHHSDHVSDLPTLATARWVAGGHDPLTIVAPAGPCARYAQRCLDGFDDQAFYSQAGADAPPRPTLTVTAFTPAETPTAVFVQDGWRAALVDHHPFEAAVGYRIDVHHRSVAISGDTAVCDGVAELAARRLARPRSGATRSSLTAIAGLERECAFSRRACSFGRPAQPRALAPASGAAVGRRRGGLRG
jgi:ribonuclease Z